MINGETFVHGFGSGNTFLGGSAGNMTMTGGGNTVAGQYALGSSTTGSSNTAIGNGTLGRVGKLAVCRLRREDYIDAGGVLHFNRPLERGPLAVRDMRRALGAVLERHPLRLDRNRHVLILPGVIVDHRRQRWSR